MAEIKEIQWHWEYGLYLPTCPYCNEPAYEKDRCVFCEKEYKWVESEIKDTVVTVGDYTVVQLSNNAIYVLKGEAIAMHASCAKKMTEDELKEMVAHYEDICNTNIDEEEEDEQRKEDEGK